jgi:hypothetical protein
VWEDYIATLKKYRVAGYDSTLTDWFLTLPRGDSKFGDIPLK